MKRYPEDAHPQLGTLPEWPTRTVAVLSTIDAGPHAIPVSAPIRAGDRRILLSLKRSRGSLARLRRSPQVALLVVAAGNMAFTARGTASIVEEPMRGAPDYAAVAIEVEAIDDHRQTGFVVESGIDRRWLDATEQHALGQRVEKLRQLAAESTPRLIEPTAHSSTGQQSNSESEATPR